MSFDYDDRALDTKVESVDDSSESWRHEVVSVDSAYGDERLGIHLFLPRNVEPPYQAVVYFPPSSARYHRDSSRPSFPYAYFIPKSGRALVYPIYQGTYERQFETRGPNGYRDLTIQIGKDLRRTVEYLETRDDIDSSRLAYYGLSWGASMGPVMTAIEPRFQASVLLAGGLYISPPDWPPEAVPRNFAPRSTVPTVMINGDDQRTQGLRVPSGDRNPADVRHAGNTRRTQAPGPSRWRPCASLAERGDPRGAGLARSLPRPGRHPELIACILQAWYR
jgi:hypothetical protein